MVCSPLYPFLIHWMLSTCKWLHSRKIISDQPYQIQMKAKKCLIEENMLTVPVLPLWKNGLGVVYEKSSKAQVGQLLFSQKSVFLTEVFNTGFALEFCYSLPITLLPFTILQDTSYFPLSGKTKQGFFFTTQVSPINLLWKFWET